ncbi:hypothetical protein ACFQ1I_13515 [Kitasatospora arboriphila]
MTFVQLIECRTDKVDDLNRLMDSWIEQTRGRRTATHSMVGADRSDARHVVEIVEFPSYEEAMRNSKLPETDRIFHEMVALCDEPPTFTDLDIVRDDQLNKAAVRQLMQRMSAATSASSTNSSPRTTTTTTSPTRRTRWGARPSGRSAPATSKPST